MSATNQKIAVVPLFALVASVLNAWMTTVVATDGSVKAAFAWQVVMKILIAPCSQVAKPVTVNIVDAKPTASVFCLREVGRRYV